MIDFITTSLFLPMVINGFDIIVSIMFIIAVICGCVSLFNDTPQTNKKMKSYSRRNNYSRINDEEHYNDYDPSWDDAYFEKTGIDPWFDDNSKR